MLEPSVNLACGGTVTVIVLPPIGTSTPVWKKITSVADWAPTVLGSELTLPKGSSYGVPCAVATVLNKAARQTRRKMNAGRRLRYLNGLEFVASTINVYKFEFE